MKRWLLTALSFAAVVGVSVYAVMRDSPGTIALWLPLPAHLLALAAVLTEIAARSIKLTWSAKSVGVRLPFRVAVRTSLAGDFGASITPARSGAEPARYMVLAEAGIPAAGALVVLFAELFLEMLSLATVVVVVAFVFRNAGTVLHALVGVVGAYSAFVIGIGVAGVIMARRDLGRKPPSWLARLGIRGRRWRSVHEWFAKIRTSVDAMRNVDLRWATLSYLASVVHVAMRLCVLPALVFGAGETAPLAPLALWPLGFLYGAAVVPAPGGGGAVELAFRAALSGIIPRRIFAASLLWWRFYTFYLYIILGGLVAGGVALRAIRRAQEAEEEFEEGGENGDGEPREPATVEGGNSRG